MKRRNLPKIMLVILSVGMLLIAGHAFAAQPDRDPAAAPQRVVALSRSNTELWLLAGGSPVGITQDASDLEGLPETAVVIGTISKPNFESIIALEPDLVLFASEIPSQTALREQMESLGIPCREVDINSFEDYLTLLKEFTEMTGREDLYQQNGETAAEQIRQSREAAQQNPAQGTFLTLRVSATKNRVLKSDYFGNRIFTDLGLTNAVSDDSPLDELNIEAVIEADPDHIFIVLQGDQDKAMESYRAAYESAPAWSGLKAVQNGHLHFLPKELFHYKPHANWGQAYAYAKEILGQ